MNAGVAEPAGARRPGWVRALALLLVALGLALGVGLMLLGAQVYSAAQVAHPVQISGVVADFKEVDIEGGYAYNELWLAGDNHIYTFDRRQFHPALPQRLYQDAPIHIWVDHGTTHVLALTLYDLLGVNAQTYTTPAYDDPVSPVIQAQRQGVVTGVSGAGVVVVVLLWLLAARLTRRARTQTRRARTQAPRPALAPAPAPLGAQPLPPAAPASRVTRAPAVDEMPTRPAPAISPTAAPPAFTAPPDIEEFPTQKAPSVSPGSAYDALDRNRQG
ncbi:MAG TPA: hypothetical protein VGR57_10425 [Ktedonobacterales bacterium]|nr:hypothetical protein [Ktedonobacterales bacterium]